LKYDKNCRTVEVKLSVEKYIQIFNNYPMDVNKFSKEIKLSSCENVFSKLKTSVTCQILRNSLEKQNVLVTLDRCANMQRENIILGTKEKENIEMRRSETLSAFTLLFHLVFCDEVTV